LKLTQSAIAILILFLILRDSNSQPHILIGILSALR
jgi:hypothetical protein